MRIAKWQELNSLNYCIDPNQILLSDIDLQLHVDRELYTGAKSATYDCLVEFAFIPVN